MPVAGAVPWAQTCSYQAGLSTLLPSLAAPGATAGRKEGRDLLGTAWALPLLWNPVECCDLQISCRCEAVRLMGF